MPIPPTHAPEARLRWVYPLALALMVVVASGRGQVAAPAINHIDKAGHFLVFGLLATLLARCPGARPYRRAILIASLFGVGDEFRQSFTPGRAVEFADWVADTLGAVAAVSLHAFWPRYRELLETPVFRRRLAPPARRPASSSSPASAA